MSVSYTIQDVHPAKLLENIDEFEYKLNFYVFDDVTYQSYTYLCVHPHNNKFILSLKDSDNSMKEFRIESINDLIKDKRIVIGDYDEVFMSKHRIFLLENKIKWYKNRIQEIEKSRNKL